MVTTKEETVVKEEKYFVCIFLDENKQCLVEKKECPQDRMDKKCQETEDIFQ